MKKIILLFCTLYIISSCSSWYRTLEEAYKNSDYETLKKMYHIIWEQENLSAENLHNLGNLSYIFWTQESENISLLEASKKYFEESLLIRENLDTRYNHTIVVSLLEEKKEQKTQESSHNKDETPDTSDSWDEWLSDTESKNWDNKDTNTQNSIWNNSNLPQSPRDEIYRRWEKDSVQKLTENERKTLEKLAEELSKEQREYQQFFWKQETTWNNSIFDQFFTDSFFFSEIESSREKDW